MQVTELRKKGLEREFKIIVSSKDVSDKLNGSLLQMSKDIEIEGVRSGPVAISSLERNMEEK